MDMATFRAPDSLKVTDLRVGIANGRWNVVGSGHLGEGPLSATESGDRPTGADYNITVFLPASVEGKDVELAAYDGSGKRLRLQALESPIADRKTGQMKQTFGFDGGSPADHVELLAREYEWVTFRGVHLYPK
jgi:hypothetical protein